MSDNLMRLNSIFFSLLYIETADRPGLLVEIIKVIADVNIDVESAEIDTEVSSSLSCLHPSVGCY
jgi:UTP:GlnB (protein PII) uridylyltransferase